MNNFIYEGHINHRLCDKIVEFHKNSNDKSEGFVYQGNNNLVNKNVKDSTDVILNLNEELFVEYTEKLRDIANSYMMIYPSCNWYSPFGISEGVIVQYYSPGGGYKTWHAERGTANSIASNRHLVFLTYLNDVDDGGGTEFFNQSLVVHAKKGRTLIWPADWTHTHRGVVSPTQEKYIVTGWLSYLDAENANV